MASLLVSLFLDETASCLVCWKPFYYLLTPKSLRDIVLLRFKRFLATFSLKDRLRSPGVSNPRLLDNSRL